MRLQSNSWLFALSICVIVAVTLGAFRVESLVVDNSATIGTQLSAPEVDIGRGVLGVPGNGPGLCAPSAPTPQGSGGPYDPYGYVPAGCPGFPTGYSILDLDLTGGDVTIDGLPEGSPGQILVLINEGGANLYLYNNILSTEWPFLLPGFHEQWLALTEKLGGRLEVWSHAVRRELLAGDDRLGFRTHDASRSRARI